MLLQERERKIKIKAWDNIESEINLLQCFVNIQLRKFHKIRKKMAIPTLLNLFSYIYSDITVHFSNSGA